MRFEIWNVKGFLCKQDKNTLKELRLITNIIIENIYVYEKDDRSHINYVSVWYKFEKFKIYMYVKIIKIIKLFIWNYVFLLQFPTRSLKAKINESDHLGSYISPTGPA